MVGAVRDTATPVPFDPTDPALAGRVIAGCALETLLGSGGMGAVWKAHHQGLDLPVAVKLLLPLKELEATGAERLLREARAAARLRHANIVGVLNVGEEAGVPFLVMEFVDGQSLQQRLQASGKLPLGEALGIVRQVLAALELTFEYHIVHRDIKPDNVLIDRHGRVRLVDLGLAKEVDANLSLTRTGAVMGSPYYIAPEQAANSKAVDTRADLYALGCTFFHMLAGAPPYRGATYLEIILQHIQGPPADLSTLDSSIPPPIVAIVGRMMAKDPMQRYQTPTEVLADLAAWEAGPVAAPQADGSGRRRARRAACLASAGALVLALVLWLGLRGSGDHRPAQTAVVPSPVVASPQSGAPESATSVSAVAPARGRPAPRATPAARGEPQRARGNPLLDALTNRDTERLRRLLDRGSPPNVSSGGMTPLRYAVLIGDGRAVRMLLERGANPNTPDAAGETALHLALQQGHREMVANLLDFGANPNLPDRTGRSPLALAGGDAYLVRKLTEKGAHP